MKEKILEEIKLLADKYRVLNNLLLAIMSGIIGIVFGITQNKLIINFYFIVFLIGGLILAGIVSYKIYLINKNREKLIMKLKDKKWKK